MSAVKKVNWFWVLSVGFSISEEKRKRKRNSHRSSAVFQNWNSVYKLHRNGFLGFPPDLMNTEIIIRGKAYFKSPPFKCHIQHHRVQIALWFGDCLMLVIRTLEESTFNQAQSTKCVFALPLWALWHINHSASRWPWSTMSHTQSNTSLHPWALYKVYTCLFILFFLCFVLVRSIVRLLVVFVVVLNYWFQILFISWMGYKCLLYVKVLRFM